MKIALFRCGTCANPLHSFRHPACSTCLSYLKLCPDLCPTCGGPACIPTGECQRPWRATPFIQSYAALYFLAGPAYPLLKSWKFRRGLFFDRKILVKNAFIQNYLERLKPDWIIPIPHRPHRSWILKGSPTLKIAQWICREFSLGTPAPLLAKKPNFFLHTHQGRLRQAERIQTDLRFVMNPKIPPSQRTGKVLLIDDIFTTGHTLRSAGNTLKQAGFKSVHAFALGYRPQLLSLRR